MGMIKPSTSPPKQPGSKEIVDEFLASDLKRCMVDIEGLDRSHNSVYVALRGYLASHPGLGVKVSIQDGQITLIKE